MSLRFADRIPHAPGGANDLSLEEKEDYDSEARKLKNLSFKQDIEQRKGHANKAFWLAIGWIAGVLILLVMNGSDDPIEIFYWGGIYHLRVKISDPVMLSLVGSTTLNILGGFYIVMKYLFKAKSEP